MTITLRQSVYAHKILQLYYTSDKPTVRTPLEQGVCLSAADSPVLVYPALHCCYSGTTSYISFLMTMMCCNLASAYAELSKFVQHLGPVHLRAAECVLQYFLGTWEDGITYSGPGEARGN